MEQINLNVLEDSVKRLGKVQGVKGKATATRYLNDLENYFIGKVGSTEVGTLYVLKGLNIGS